MMSGKDIKEFHNLDKLKKKHGGTQEECQVIQKRADQWCRENGYPVQRSKYWKRKK